MSLISRILSISLSLILLFSIIELIRRNKLKEKYAILWLITGISILLLAVFEKLLYWITAIFGIAMPINAIFFLGIFFIILMSLHFSLAISNLVEQNKRLAQRLALLELEIKNKTVK